MATRAIFTVAGNKWSTLQMVIRGNRVGFLDGVLTMHFYFLLFLERALIGHLLIAIYQCPVK